MLKDAWNNNFVAFTYILSQKNIQFSQTFACFADKSYLRWRLCSLFFVILKSKWSFINIRNVNYPKHIWQFAR